ncbi:MAG: FAD/NAD(P)-binding protein [Cyanobacteria bacterium P01_A01_bin.116]
MNCHVRIDHIRIAIAGAGISGFAALGHLVENLRAVPSTKVVIYWLQPPRNIQTNNLSVAQRDRLAHLKSIGIDPTQLFGGGQVYHPSQPSLFTFNGSSAARGFNFVAQRYDSTDYFEWVQANRPLLAAIYPDFAPETGQQRHPAHTLDDIQGTTPRGAYGLYLHHQFLALQAHLPTHIQLKIIPEALQSYTQTKQTIALKTNTQQWRVDYLIKATGHRFAQLRPEWAGRVFRAYPCDGYGQNLPDQITVVGAGPAGIEVALHALHNLHVKQVTLISRLGQSRLPQAEPTEPYQCQWFTRENMRRQPTIKNAEALLRKELAACYQACNLPYPGWDALSQIEDYPNFLEHYLQTTKQSPNHPFAHLVRPVMSFYAQVKDLLPAIEQTGVLQLIHQVKPLFATQSRPCAELMLAALKAKRLKLIAGEFLPAQTTPTVLLSDGTHLHPDCMILATGFVSSIPPFYPQPSHTRCHSVTGTSLSSVNAQAASIASMITRTVVQSLYAKKPT